MKPGAKRILILCLAILAGAWLLAEYMSGALGQEESVQVGAALSLIDLSPGPAESVTALSWTRGGQTVNLVRDADTGLWRDADDDSCPIDSKAVQGLVQALARARADMVISAVVDFSQYGLTEPNLSIVAAADGRVTRYELGNITLGGEYYLRMDGSDSVYLETGTLAPAFSRTRGELLALESIPGDIAEAIGLSVRTEAESYELEKDGGLWYRADAGEEPALETEKVLALVEPLTELTFTRCVSWRAEEAAAYGLDEPQGVVSLRYDNRAGGSQTFTLEFGAYEGPDIYVRFADSDRIYLIGAETLDRLMYPDWEAMRPMTALPVELERISLVRAQLDGVWHEIMRLEETTQTAVSDGESVDVTEVIYSCSGWVLARSRVEPWLESLLSLSGDGAAGAGEGRKLLFAVELIYSEEEPAAEENDNEESQEQTEALDEAGEGEEGEASTEELTQSAAFYTYDSARDLCVCGDGRRLLISRGQAQALADRLGRILSDE